MIKKLLIVFISIGICAVFGLFFYFSAEGLIKSIKAGNWPTVDGLIKSSELKSKTHGGGGTTYEAKIIYEYEVGGVIYTGNNIAFGYESGSRRSYEDAKAVIDHIGDAKIVVVRYDPSAPQISTLSFGAHKTVLFDLAYMFLGFLFTIAFLFMLPKILAEPDSA